MGRLMLVALLAQVLPSAALANSFNFKNAAQTGGQCTQIVGNSVCRTGDFVSGSISSFLVGPFKAEMIGSMNTITIQLGNLSCSSVTTCAFTNLGAEVFHNGVGIFDIGGLVNSGELTRTATTATISADFGGGYTVFFDSSFSGNTLKSGNAFVTFPPIPPPVPEPSVLEGLLLGTGFIGVVAMVGSKLKLLT